MSRLLTRLLTRGLHYPWGVGMPPTDTWMVNDADGRAESPGRARRLSAWTDSP